MIDAHSKLFSRKELVKSLISLPNGLLITGSDDREIKVKVWNISNTPPLKPLIGKDLSSVVHSMTVLNKASKLIAIGSDSSIKVMNYESGMLEESFDDDNGKVKYYKCVILYDKNHLLSGNDDGDITLWSIQSREMIKSAINSETDTPSPVSALKVFANGNIASASTSSTVIIWNKNLDIIKSFQTNSGVYALAVLPNGDLASSGDGVIEIWRGANNEFDLLAELHGHVGPVLALDVLKYGHLISGGEDKTVKIWNTNSGALVQTLQSHKDQIISLNAMENGYIASGDKDGFVGIWSL